MTLASYYDESYPPSVWEGGGGGVATSAEQGSPGTWLPEGSTPPTYHDLFTGVVPVTAIPTTVWGEGGHVVTSDGVHAFWDGAAWDAPTPATGVAGAPGHWAPPGSAPPWSFELFLPGTPDTKWTSGQYIVFGNLQEGHCDGGGWWVPGRAP